jgi:hypothetical protein
MHFNLMKNSFKIKNWRNFILKLKIIKIEINILKATYIILIFFANNII